MTKHLTVVVVTQCSHCIDGHQTGQVWAASEEVMEAFWDVAEMISNGWNVCILRCPDSRPQRGPPGCGVGARVAHLDLFSLTGREGRATMV